MTYRDECRRCIDAAKGQLASLFGETQETTHKLFSRDDVPENIKAAIENLTAAIDYLDSLPPGPPSDLPNGGAA